VIFNIKDGSSPILAIMLIVVLVAVGAFGFILLVNQYDVRMQRVTDDPVNISGINYSSDVGQALNLSAHGLSQQAPYLVLIVLIFLAVAFISLLAIALKYK
jgi:hypothetical protein